MGREEWLEQLVKKNGLRMGAELGLWYGRTFLHLLKNCPALTLYGVDLFAPQPDHTGPENWVKWDHEGNEQRVREGAKPYGDRAIILKMFTSEAVNEIPDDSLGFVFIDADHSSEGVRRDIKDWLPKIKKGGFVTGHDIDWPTVEAVVREFFPDYQKGPDNIWWVQNV